jgi:hypothetical protein
MDITLTDYKIILNNILFSRLTPYVDGIMGIINEYFDLIDQLLFRYSLFVTYWKKWEYNGTVHQLFIQFEKTYGTVRGKLPYNILTEFGIPIKLVKPNENVFKRNL